MVEVRVARLGLDSTTNTYVVVLQEAGGTRILPIWIGHPEAEAIALHINNVRRERPFTHDLCRNLIVGMGGTLKRVQITRVQKSTYYAELHIARDAGPVQIDARPSDSIAIALRLSAPIFVQESLLLVVEGEDEPDDAPITPAPPDPDELTAEKLKEYLENLRPEDFGKFNL